jgi:hypothetical protein
MAGTKRTVGVDEAAGILGISKEALRKRIKRGTIEAVKDTAGKWQVILEDKGQDKGPDSGQDGSGTAASTDKDDLIAHLKGEIEFMRQEMHRKDVIIMNLSDGIKQLEAPKKRTFWERLRGTDPDSD